MRERWWSPTAAAVLYGLGWLVALASGGGMAWLHFVAEGARVAALLMAGLMVARRRSVTVWIVWAMVAGVELGVDAPGLSLHLKVFSDIFLRLIRTIVAPLILGTLITGIAGHARGRDEGEGLGRIGLKALVYFEVSTTIALAVGLVAINVSRAGVGLAGQAARGAVVAEVSSPQQLRWEEFLLHVVPENLAKSVAENQLLQVAVFAVLFGLALARVGEEQRRPLMAVVESLTKTMFQFTNLVMYMAPLAVGAALAYTVAHAGAVAMVSLGKLLLTLYGALVVFAGVGLLPAALLARVPLRRFLKAVAEPATIAFATSTSEAALPVAMERMEEMGVPARIVGFVMPAGYSFNLAGSALYLSLAAVFVAQAGGLHMGWGQQVAMLATLMLTSKGVAGVPRAVLVVLTATAASFHLPEGPIVLLLGVDALMDMGRTLVNVVGNCLATVVVANWRSQPLVAGEEPVVLTE